jgi:phage terminase large subunit-like protein
MVEGDSGIMSVSPPWNRPIYQPSKRRLTWPNGSVGITFSGDKPDQLRGPQFHKAWVDEIAKFQYPTDTWDNLEFGLRLGLKPQAIVTTTPRPIPLIKGMVTDPQTITTRVSTYANIANLAASYIKRVIKKYEGTRLGRQELYADILSDTPGSLWTYETIEGCRVSKHVGQFAKMEDQMVITTSDGYMGNGSPDRMDAMVWAVSDLMFGVQASADPLAYADSKW